MTTNEFIDFYLKLTNGILPKYGYKLKGRNWHLITDDLQLTLFFNSNKNALLTDSRLVFLALNHRKVKNFDDKFTPDYEKEPLLYPVCIAPSILDRFVNSGFDSLHWRYSPVLLDFDNNRIQDQIFYGKYNNEIGRLLKIFGWIKKKSTDIETQIEIIANNVGEYGQIWGSYLTPNRLLDELEESKENYEIKDNWIKCYKDYLI